MVEGIQRDKQDDRQGDKQKNIVIISRQPDWRHKYGDMSYNANPKIKIKVIKQRDTDILCW